MRTTRVRLSPAARREQLLDIGMRLIGTQPLDELSIDQLAEEAQVSRGLLYHYFANMQEFHRAVVQRAADDLILVTAPTPGRDPIPQLLASLAAYLDYVTVNHQGYLSLVQAASSGDDDVRRIYWDARNALTDRIFEVADPDTLAALGVRDTPAVRMMARGWCALVEQVVLDWLEDPRGISREALLESLTGSLTAVAGATR